MANSRRPSGTSKPRDTARGTANLPKLFVAIDQRAKISDETIGDGERSGAVCHGKNGVAHHHSLVEINAVGNVSKASNDQLDVLVEVDSQMGRVAVHLKEDLAMMTFHDH